MPGLDISHEYDVEFSTIDAPDFEIAVTKNLPRSILLPIWTSLIPFVFDSIVIPLFMMLCVLLCDWWVKDTHVFNIVNTFINLFYKYFKI